MGGRSKTCLTYMLPVRPRNFLFELLVTARFYLAGYAIDFDDTSDVVDKRDGLIVRAECKRLASEKQLEKRISYAAEQLATSMKNANDEAIGLIFIDVSSCVSSGLGQILNMAEDAEKEMNTALRSFLVSNAQMIDILNRKHIDVSYATCLIGTLPFWTSDFVMHSCAATAVRSAETLSDEKYEQLENVLAGFDETFIKIF